ncbi:c-type cytochrome [Tenacibaculum sp. M341]|uniref:c-type cytochrome n=1 Tax=Tenacibaculum sp. M341 TaxID=2530339 RepID=UPI0010514607|nr:c-type cytochrome [Tenacibaculum sp. M341]TCI91497.1 c-type cytochrome [Tenacibaculum sp. M341]
MKLTANDILGFILSLILIPVLFWVISIQVREKFPKANDSFKMKKVVIIRKKNESYERGKDIFINEGCVSCHKIQAKDGFRRGVKDRYEIEWLFQYIRDEQSLIDKKDKLVLNLNSEFKWTNSDHNKNHLTDEQLNDLLIYLDGK